MQKIKARIAADNEAMAEVPEVEIFGLTLTRSFKVFDDVPDDVLAKLRANSTVEVLVRASKPAADDTAPANAPSLTERQAQIQELAAAFVDHLNGLSDEEIATGIEQLHAEGGSVFGGPDEEPEPEPDPAQAGPATAADPEPASTVSGGDGDDTVAAAGEPGPPAGADAYPNLTEAQEKALDRDGDGKPGGAPKGGNRRRKAAE